MNAASFTFTGNSAISFWHVEVDSSGSSCNFLGKLQLRTVPCRTSHAHAHARVYLHANHATMLTALTTFIMLTVLALLTALTMFTVLTVLTTLPLHTWFTN